MKVLKVDEDNKTVQIELGRDEPVETDEGPVISEFEVPGSDRWCNAGPGPITSKLGTLIQAHPALFEVTIRMGKPWTVKKLVMASEVAFPSGTPLSDRVKARVEEAEGS